MRVIKGVANITDQVHVKRLAEQISKSIAMSVREMTASINEISQNLSEFYNLR